MFTRQVGDYGSYHGAEIPFVFRNTQEESGLVDTVSSAWVSFARSGVPSAEGLEEWKPYTREDGATMILDEESYLAHGHDRALMELLAPGYEY